MTTETPRQPKSEGVNSFSAESVLKLREKKRIDSGVDFRNIYGGNYDNDMERVEEMRKIYSSHEREEKLSELAEALVLACIERGALGQGVDARATNKYDDYFKGADLIIENRMSSSHGEPVVAAIDVTLDQKDIKGSNRGVFMGGEQRPSGFEKKLERVKKHVDLLASLKRDEAVKLSAWLKSGGMSQVRTSINESFFTLAERIMSVKYYRSPTFSSDPYKVTYVINGPQIVVSLDTVFINKILSRGESSQRTEVESLSNLLQMEIPLSIALLSQYVESKAVTLEKNGGGNLFFDGYRSSCLAWELFFSGDQQKFRIEETLKKIGQNLDLRSQISYFQKTLRSVFCD